MTSLQAPEGTYGHFIQIEPFIDEHLKSALTEVIKETSYNGIFSVDMLVGNDNKIYFLEINFRHSAFSYACNYGGINLIKEWAMATINGDIDENALNEKRLLQPYKAIAEFDDFRQCLFLKTKGPMKWLNNVLSADVHFYYNPKDIKPFFAGIFHHVKTKLRKHNKISIIIL